MNSLRSTNDFNSRMELELLKKDVSTVTTLIGKFDTTMEKLQEIATSLSKMISIQEIRLESQESTTKNIVMTLESRRMDHMSDIKDIHNKIDSISKDLTKKIEDTELAILKKIEDINEKIGKNDEDLESRVGKIEAWKYMVMGAIAIIAFVVGSASDLMGKLF